MTHLSTIAGGWAPLELGLRMAGLPRHAIDLARWAFYSGACETLAQLSQPEAKASLRADMLAELSEYYGLNSPWWSRLPPDQPDAAGK